MRYLVFSMFLALALIAAPIMMQSASAQSELPTAADSKTDTMPLTASSAAARRHFQAALVLYENIQLPQAIQELQAAVQLDPGFAVAHALICLATTDPALESSQRAKAKSTAQHATPAEQLMIRWVVGVHENDQLRGIAAMNDLLAQYPRDLSVAFMAGRWTKEQAQYDASERIFLRVLAVQPNFAAAINQLAYIYARTGRYDKALPLMAKYVQLLPNEPNPQDSYGEISRMAGDFPAALRHFHQSLQIDPTFFLSQEGLATTYALMGQQETARVEYAKAIAMTPDRARRMEWMVLSAITYVRENKLAEADKAFEDIAETSRKAHMGTWEATAYWDMAMYQPDHKVALKDLQLAEAALAGDKDTAQFSLDEKRADILRLRVERELQSGNAKAASDALAKLEKLSLTAKDNMVETAYHAAAGAVLFQQKQYAKAVAHLEEDPYSPRTMKLLIAAYEKTGDAESAKLISTRLAGWDFPTLEQALIVPQFRAGK